LILFRSHLRNGRSVMALAESDDGGRSFARSMLGLHEFNGSTENNILWNGGTPGIPVAFLDTNPRCRDHERYKGLASRWQKDRSAGEQDLYVMASDDGLRWRRMQDGPVEMPGAFDTINTAFWDDLAGGYRSYTRYFNPAHKPVAGGMGVRGIQMSTSDDFLHWTPPVPLEYEDGDERMQLYTNAIVPCPGAEHIYVGFPNRIVETRESCSGQPWPGVNDALFMASRDGVHWTRYREAWVRPGLDPRNWTQRNNYPLWHIIRTSPEEWSILISEHYKQEDRTPVRLRRLAIRPWGFVSVHAGFDGGELTTRPLVFEGRSLRLNYATSAAGSLQVEVQDEDGRALDGFNMNDMRPMFGDALDAPVRWGETNDLTGMTGKPVRLRLSLKDADLFSFRFTNKQQGE
ncbi:hypothetical protein LCGC14_1523210, partial [marine sediment metagenome]